MILTPEQQAGWEAELAEYNAGITRSNQSITEHNALLPPEVEPVPLRDLLTLDQYIQLKLDEVARAGANKARSEAKTNLQLLTERDAIAVQLAAVEADKLVIEAARVQLVSDLAAKTAQYDAEVVKVTALEAEKATLTTDLATRTEELSEKTQLLNSGATVITGLESQVASLTSQLAAKTEELAESKAELLSQIDSLEAERIILNAKVTFLNSIRTYDPNSIRSLAFYDRITKDQINKLGLAAITDPQAAEIHVLLNAYKNNPWPVLLNDPLVVGGIQYLTYIEIITPEEAAQIIRPATRNEAFIAE